MSSTYNKHLRKCYEETTLLDMDRLNVQYFVHCCYKECKFVFGKDMDMLRAPDR